LSPASAKTPVEVDGRTLTVSNLDKVLYAGAGFTKGQVIDYYARIAPVLLPHLAGRPITLKRYPDGVEGEAFYEKNCPKFHPDWMPTISMLVSSRTKKPIAFCHLTEPAALVWTANLAAIELHPGLQREPELDSPTHMVFDLDPGPGSDIVTCCQVAVWLRDAIGHFGLEGFCKTSGSKGLQMYVPFNTGVTFDDTRELSLAFAQLMEKQHPELVVTSQSKELRPGKVLIDWSQNVRHKSTVSVYSLRARERPTVSTPVTWDEVDDALAADDASRLRFEADDVLARVEEHGDLFAPVLTLEQQLPRLS
jgi:bifunctional non-homologous end joining protein LigD